MRRSVGALLLGCRPMAVPSSFLPSNLLLLGNHQGRAISSSDGHYQAEAVIGVSGSLATRELPGREVAFQPDFTLGAQFAGIAVARAEGVYAARGLNVAVLPPCPGRPGDEVQQVVNLQEALAHDGLIIGSTEQNVLVAARGEGLPVRGVSAMLQRTPLSLGALPGSVLSGLPDLRGKTVGMARDEVPLFHGMLKAAGVEGVSVVEVTHEDKQQRLLDGSVDAIQIYDTTEVVDLQGKTGSLPVVLPIGQEPYDRGYAQVVFAAEEALASEVLRETLRDFLSATYEGWRRAAADTSAAALAVTLMTGEDPTPEALAYHQNVLLRFLPYLEPNRAQPSALSSAFALGTIQPSRWLNTIETYGMVGLVPTHLAEDVSHTADLSLWPGATLFQSPGGSGRCVSVSGQAVAEQIRAEAAASAGVMVSRHGRRPGLAVLRFGRVPPVEAFRRSEVPAKQRTSWYCMDTAGAGVGIDVAIKRLPEDASERDVEALLAELNATETVDAVMVEIPIPSGLSYNKLVSQVHPSKRVDALESESLGSLMFPEAGRAAPLHAVPVTPTSCMEMLSRAGVAVHGRKIVVVGYGRLAGAPLVQMLLGKGATVTVCTAHTAPEDLKVMSLAADIIISAAGSPGLITKEHVASGAVVVNLGTVFDEELNVLLPDVSSTVAEKASVLIGCPGGVGTVPAAVLLRSVAVNAHARAVRIHQSPEVLSQAEISLPAGWGYGSRSNGTSYVCPDEGPTGLPLKDTLSITRTYKAPSFAKAAEFMQAVAAIAETNNHHPDLSLKDFCHVTVDLSSVSLGGVTELDLLMAWQINEAAGSTVDSH